MTKMAENINYTILDASKCPKIDPATFRGHVLASVAALIEAASDGIAGLSDIHVEAMKFVWKDGKQRSEQDVFRLVQDVMHSVGDTTKSGLKWLHKEGGRRMGSGTGGRLGARKYDPVVIPAGKYVWISDDNDPDDPSGLTLVDTRPIHAESELRFKIRDVGDVLPQFMAWLTSLKGAHVKVRNAVMEASMTIATKDRDAAILAWHNGGQNVDAARKAFQLIV